MQIVPGEEFGRPWMVCHRFNEFRTLHEQLVTFFETESSKLEDLAAKSDKKSSSISAATSETSQTSS